MARRKSPPSLSEQLRAILQEETKDGSTVYELAQAVGVDRSVLSRFLAGKRTITLETADRLAAVLGFRIVGRGAPIPRHRPRRATLDPEHPSV
jgi:transcriptional regulator with XRE-family HTH domain